LYEHVHEKVPSRGKNEESFEAEALCVSAGHEHRGNDGEHHLEMAISALRNMQVFVPAQDVKINTEGEGMGWGMYGRLKLTSWNMMLLKSPMIGRGSHHDASGPSARLQHECKL
jgi:hypothetical protein